MVRFTFLVGLASRTICSSLGGLRLQCNLYIHQRMAFRVHVYSGSVVFHQGMIYIRYRPRILHSYRIQYHRDNNLREWSKQSPDHSSGNPCIGFSVFAFPYRAEKVPAAVNKVIDTSIQMLRPSPRSQLPSSSAQFPGSEPSGEILDGAQAVHQLLQTLA